MVSQFPQPTSNLTIPNFIFLNKKNYHSFIMGCMNSTPQGILTVHLVKMTNLVDGDYVGKTDPYVTFTLEQDNWVFDHTMGKVTSKKKSNTLNPEYDETFKFPVSSLENLVLHVNVYDDDMGIDDKLAAIDIKVDDINPGTTPVLVERTIDEKKGKWFARDSKIFLNLSYTAAPAESAAAAE
jgi:Ca2+-dependent lipid-binding protein